MSTTPWLGLRVRRPHGSKAFPYLKARRFKEFIDAPPLDDGYYVIAPEREEWAP